jgi:hypothetical protein
MSQECPLMPPPKKKKPPLIGIETDRSRPEARPRLPKNAPHGEFLGDQRVFTDQLYAVDQNQNPTGPPVGHHSGICTLVKKGPGNARFYQCFATFDLPDGLLTGRTLFDLTAVGPAGIKVAVTGGTETYAGTGGQITATFPAAGITLFKFDLA